MMKGKRWLLCLWLLLVAGAIWAQAPRQVEYFFDHDPGHGQATPITGISEGENALSLSTEGLSPGAHLLFIRAQSDDNAWSTTTARAFYLASKHSDQPTRLEYFFDTDPGYGLGTPVDGSLSLGDNSFSLSTVGLLPGGHTLYLRAQGEGGQWSTMIARPFVLVSTTVLNLKKLEYFFDADPGYGQGRVVTSLNEGEQQVALSTEGLAPGAHILFMRVQTDDNSWSAVQARPFYVSSPKAQQPARIEYFFDTDPGYGKGQSINLTASTSELSLSLGDLGYGAHVLFMRIQDEQGRWSSIQPRPFYICERQGFQALEYYIDNDDPGTGKATAIGEPPFYRDLKELVFDVPTDGLAKGEHKLHIRGLDIEGNWAEVSNATFTVSVDQVPTPHISYANHQVTITCSQADAKIRYTLDGSQPTAESTLYEGPFTVDRNLTVKAIAFADHKEASDVATLDIDLFKAANVEFTYNGRYLKMGTATEDAAIYYTLDGSEPTTASARFQSEIDVAGLPTVKAIAVKEGLTNSAVADYAVPCYYDGTTAQVRTAGTLSQAFGWCDAQGIARLTVTGSIDDADVATLRTLGRLQHADLKDAVTATLPDNAFGNMPLLTIELPAALSGAGQSLFSGCRQLAAIGWNAAIAVPAGALNGTDNPNLLLYVTQASLAAQAGVTNVVAGTTAQRIVLADADGNGNFYCPRPFTAQTVSYTHRYTMQSGLDKSRGWETLALPFDVQTITHEQQGAITPFAAYTGDVEQRPFWLCELTAGGWSEVAQIKANTPYLIAMPNNEAYSEQYQLAGNVTFAASNALIPATEAHASTAGNTQFVPTTISVSEATSVYALNLAPFEQYEEGSVFVANRDVRPFEAYRTTTSGVRLLLISDEMPTGIRSIGRDDADGDAVYDLQGRKMASGNALGHGIYIVKGKKVLVK